MTECPYKEKCIEKEMFSATICDNKVKCGLRNIYDKYKENE